MLRHQSAGKASSAENDDRSLLERRNQEVSFVAQSSAQLKPRPKQEARGRQAMPPDRLRVAPFRKRRADFLQHLATPVIF